MEDNPGCLFVVHGCQRTAQVTHLNMGRVKLKDYQTLVSPRPVVPIRHGVGRLPKSLQEMIPRFSVNPDVVESHIDPVKPLRFWSEEVTEECRCIKITARGVTRMGGVSSSS